LAKFIMYKTKKPDTANGIRLLYPLET
jgi:hypothetical protein